MPELPEVEVLRRDLDKDVVGRKIKSVEVVTMRSVRRHTKRKQFTEPLEGAKIKSVERRGKYLVLALDNEQSLVIHLGMSGQLLRAKSAKVAKPKHTHVIIGFTQGGQLRFVDPRTFGEMFVTKSDVIADELPELGHLGFDPLDAGISVDRFAALLRQRSMKLKSLLMDQKFIAGIGNIYSDEILFQAGLRFDRLSDSLSPQEVRRLFRAVIEVLQDAVKYRGSTLADEGFVDLQGNPGEYQDHHQVYGREGEPCPRTKKPIMRQRYGNRSTYYSVSQV
ncbi:MAG: bifunctional DNA-formamidopyrimidine glycosylase/DNA-(apurinic or apyrimidinic site) lyase [Acidimicrobiia bacterium]|nr:bifunctional DNA-formamidopyrimidine glycosylase/DNA-(apurinic or apyrimidinic site) lyase [Acidimicrobiia bacterium]